MAGSLLKKKLRSQQAMIWGCGLLGSSLEMLPFLSGFVLVYGLSALIIVHTPNMARIVDALLFLSFAAVLVFTVVRLGRRAGDLVCVAKILEQRDSALRSDLSNALQFLRSGVPEGTNPALVQLAIEQGEKSAARLRWNQFIPPVLPARWKQRFSGILLAGLAVLFFLSPLAARSLAGLFQPAKLSASGEPLHVLPGHAKIVSDDSLVITVVDRGGEALEWHPSDPGLKSAAFRYRSRDTATLLLPRVARSFSYSVKTLRRASPMFAVTVLDRPRIEQLRITLHFPRYTGRASVALPPDLGDFAALPGSRAEIKLFAGKRLSAGRLLLLPDSNIVPLILKGQSAQGSFPIRGNMEYEIALRDIDSLASRDGLRYRITLLEDLPPSVVLQRPEEDWVIDRSMHIEISALAQDDFGLSALRLHYRIQSEEGLAPEDSLALSLSRPGATKDTNKTSWDLRALSIYPGDEIQFYIKAWDNDAVRGRKSGRSVTRKARFPSIKEIYAQAEREEERAIADMAAARQAQERLQKETENLTRKLQGKPPGPKETARLDQLQSEQKNLMADIDSLAQNIADQLTNQLSDESVRSSVSQRLSELRRQMEMLRNTKFAQAWEQKEKMSAQPDLALLRQMLKETAAEQQDMLAQLDKTIEMLKQLQMHNRLQDLSEQLAQMADQQDSLRKAAERDPAKAGETAGRQERLARDLADLQKKMQETENDSALESALAQALASLREELNRDNTAGRMQDAASMLSRGQMQSANAQQKSAAAALRKAGSRMSALAAKMRGQSMEKLMAEIRALADQLLQISFDAESLAASTARPDFTSPEALGMGLEAAAAGLVELDRSLGYSDPVVMHQLSIAITNCRNLAAGRKNASWPVVEATNRAVVRLLQQLSQLEQMSAKAGMSLDKLMAGMMGLGAEQMMLNQMMRSMLESALRNGGKPDQSETGRLAASQRSLMERYEEMRRELSNRPDRPFDAPDLREPMQEVIRDIESGSLDPNTLQKQDHILSRMLDGNLSLQQRDFSKKRLAEIERRQLRREAPAALVPDELRRLKAGNTRYVDYPPEYHDRIRAYLHETGQ